jgi:hypothetical protein
MYQKSRIVYFIAKLEENDLKMKKNPFSEKLWAFWPAKIDNCPKYHSRLLNTLSSKTFASEGNFLELIT